MIKIKDIKLEKTAFSKEDLINDDRSKILFVGRSNVGKSSLINKILGRKDLARTASRPGKTVSINYYLINSEFYFIDLPGYGYAKISKKESQRVRNLLSLFLKHVKNVKLVFILIDSRRGFMDSDIKVLLKIVEKKLKVLTILTKSDKINHSKLINLKKYLQKTFDLKTISFSIKSNSNKEEILKIIKTAIME